MADAEQQHVGVAVVIGEHAAPGKPQQKIPVQLVTRADRQQTGQAIALALGPGLLRS